MPMVFIQIGNALMLLRAVLLNRRICDRENPELRDTVDFIKIYRVDGDYIGDCHLDKTNMAADRKAVARDFNIALNEYRTHRMSQAHE